MAGILACGGGGARSSPPGASPLQQTLRTSSEEGPLPGAADSWTWERKEAPPSQAPAAPRGERLGEGAQSGRLAARTRVSLCAHTHPQPQMP